MILRSITRHVRDQNWFAVGLDFMIVVLGVFIGLQVQQWAEGQRQARMESFYTQRLHNEIVNLLATRAELVATRQGWLEALSTATSVLFGPTGRELTELECTSISFSYIVSNPTDDLASLFEVQSSGQLVLFGNPQISSALGAFLLMRARARDADSAVQRILINLTSKYPDLIQIASTSDYSKDPWIRPRYRCDTEGMRMSRGFLNDYEINQSGYTFHVMNNARVEEGLLELMQVLEGVLGPVTRGHRHDPPLHHQARPAQARPCRCRSHAACRPARNRGSIMILRRVTEHVQEQNWFAARQLSMNERGGVK